MICSTIRREHEDPEFGLRTLSQIVDTDGEEGLSFEEVSLDRGISLDS